MDVKAAPDERRPARTAKSCGPDTPTLVSRADAQASCAMVANKPGAPGRPRISRKAIRAGKAGMSWPNLWFLPRAFFTARGPWGRQAPGLPCALRFRGSVAEHDPGTPCRGTVKMCLIGRRRSAMPKPQRSVSSSAKADDPVSQRLRSRMQLVPYNQPASCSQMARARGAIPAHFTVSGILGHPPSRVTTGSGAPNTSPILTLIRRCGGRVFSAKKTPEDASATKHQWFCRTLLAFSKGLAMLIRGARIGACDGAVSAPTIAAAPLLPTRGAHGPVGPTLSLGLLLLSRP